MAVDSFPSFSCHSLESRRFLAGDVSVVLDDELLIVVGDGQSNRVVIERASDVESVGPVGALSRFLRVRGLDGTTINGRSEFVVPMVRTRLQIDLGGGDDELELASLVIGRSSIDLGTGNDRLLTRHTRVQGDLDIRGKSGDDRIAIRDTHVQRNLSLDGGTQRDRYTLSRLRVVREFDLTDTSGATIANVHRLSVQQRSSVVTGNSMDRLAITSSAVFGDSSIRTLGQDDSVFVRGSVFHGNSPLDAGPGDNNVDREVILGWDFNDGAQGWDAGFADYFAFDEPEVDSGIQVIPDTVPNLRGFRLSGQNDSDDLFMYLTRRIGPAQGVVADKSYNLSVDINFYSNRVAGVEGMGGPSAEGVYVKLGGSEMTPALVFDPQSSNLRLNIDIGNQSNSGANATVSGTIANGNDQDNDGQRFLSVARSTPAPLAVSSDSTGSASIVAGFDSGFQGRTTVYVSSISTRLTPV